MPYTKDGQFYELNPNFQPPFPVQPAGALSPMGGLDYGKFVDVMADTVYNRDPRSGVEFQQPVNALDYFNARDTMLEKAYIENMQRQLQEQELSKAMGTPSANLNTGGGYGGGKTGTTDFASFSTRLKALGVPDASIIAAYKEQRLNEGIKAIDPSKYTPESMAIFQSTGDYSKLVPIVNNKKKEPLPVWQLTNLRHPVTLAPAPAGLTMEQAEKDGYIKTTPQQVTALFDLENTAAIINESKNLSDKIITVQTAGEANAKAPLLWAASKTGVGIPEAKLYADTKRAFTGVISRTLGAERGVLTDRDIERITNALPSFNDTVAIKDAKWKIFERLYNTAKEAAKKKILGLTGPEEQLNQANDIRTMVTQMENPIADTGTVKPQGTTVKKEGIKAGGGNTVGKYSFRAK